jgi:DNA-binding CsgD family transcriptional regulator
MRSESRVKVGGKRALVLAPPDDACGAALVRALADAAFEVDRLRTSAELHLLAERSDLPPPAVVFIIPSGNDPDDAALLAELARRSCAASREARNLGSGADALREVIASYAARRALSARQRQILALYLEGKADKEIAAICGCAEATVYEHWRRMARKAGGRIKSDGISDFHGFLASRNA